MKNYILGFVTCLILILFYLITNISYFDNQKINNDIIVKNKKTGAIIALKRDYTIIQENTEFIKFYITANPNETIRDYTRAITFNKKDIVII